MKRYKGDPPGVREREREEVRRLRRGATPGTYTGHEAGVGATAKATKRYKRSL
jgi:hypothetical protein